MKRAIVALCAWAGCLVTLHANAASVTELLGRPVENLRGDAIGPVEDLIVDAGEARVLYIIVRGDERYYTLPVHAFEPGPFGLLIDMSDVNEPAKLRSPEQVDFRRAAKLIGQPIKNPGDGRIGRLRDIQFELDSGEIERVVIADAEGVLGYLPPSTLAQNRFPPLTRWQAEHPPSDVEGYQGYIRREPTDERKSVHEHEWKR